MLDIEKLLVDIRAARAFLDRVECGVRTLAASAGESAANAAEPTPGESAPSAVNDVPVALERAPESSTATNTQEVQKAVPMGAEQAELFAIDWSDTNRPKEGKAQDAGNKKRVPKGACTLTRRQVLANFREIAGKEKILDLADVNRIFGYAPNTSGTFVKHAVKRGELGTIPYGTAVKFLAIDVKAFIKSYFDKREGLV